MIIDYFWIALEPREGVIIDPGQMLTSFDACDVIMMFWTDVFEVVDHDHDHEKRDYWLKNVRKFITKQKILLPKELDNSWWLLKLSLKA